MDFTDPNGRTAPGAATHAGPVTLINSFVVPEGRDEAFLELWTETSRYFRAQPGFVSLRLHRAVSSDAPHRFVNVAVWESAGHYRAPHQTEEFVRLVTQEGWREFPSSPALYEVVVEHRLEPSRG
ncbi:MAG TPA: antibiotic biosynthesis monooxygenase family protein [Acidimicrobiia bacterium]|jgi:heme-degrading monooxygenase HmoA|nr:antibiotic biosynthesis monooxygenase family protein [Acidimicrobiia bacterium]